MKEDSSRRMYLSARVRIQYSVPGEVRTDSVETGTRNVNELILSLSFIFISTGSPCYGHPT